MWSTATAITKNSKLPPYRRILDKGDDTEIESAVGAFSSDVLKTDKGLFLLLTPNRARWAEAFDLINVKSPICPGLGGGAVALIV